MRNAYLIAAALVLCAPAARLRAEDAVAVKEWPTAEQWMPWDVRRQVGRTFSIWPEERADAAAVIRDMGPRAFRAVPLLIRMLDDEGPIWTVAAADSPWTYPAFEAATALSAIGAPALEALKASLQHDKPLVRAHAAFALGGMRDPAAIEALLPLLTDEDWFARVCAAEALGEIGDARAVDGLLAALKDAEWNVRGSAARALGGIRDPRVTNDLIELLADRFPNVRVNAAHALALVTGANLGPDQAAWLKWREDEKR